MEQTQVYNSPPVVNSGEKGAFTIQGPDPTQVKKVSSYTITLEGDTPFNRTHKVYPNVHHCISEPESLAIEPKKLNELNDVCEMEDLVDNIKLNCYQDYKS